MKNKKAQALDGLQTIILSIATITIILAIVLVILSEMQTAIVDVTDGNVVTYGSDVYLLNSTQRATKTGTEAQLLTVTSISPTVAFATLVNQTGGSITLAESTPRFYLRLKGNLSSGEITNATITAYNGTTLINRATNYTVENVAGDIVHINFTTNKYMTDNITFVYNRTFSTSENLIGTDICYTTGVCLANLSTNVTRGSAQTFILLNSSTDYGNTLNSLSLSGRNYTVSYSMSVVTAGAGTTEASVATGKMIDKLGNVSVWVGILIVVIFASVIMTYFYFKE